MNKLNRDYSSQDSQPQHTLEYKILGVFFYIMLAVIALLGIASALSACGAKEHTSDLETEELELHPFVASKLHYDDADTAVAKMYELCTKQSEVLANVASAFPKLLDAAEFTTHDPIELDDLFDTKDGAANHLLLLIAVDGMLNVISEYTLDTWSGTAEVLYMVERVENAQNPQDFGLAWGTAELKDEQVLVVSWQEKTGEQQHAYFLISGGFQRLIPAGGHLHSSY